VLFLLLICFSCCKLCCYVFKCVMLLIVLFCVLLTVLFCVLFVCKCVLHCHHRRQHKVSYHTSHSTPFFPLYHFQCRFQIIALFYSALFWLSLNLHLSSVYCFMFRFIFCLFLSTCSAIFIVYLLFIPTNAHIYYNIKLYYKLSYMFRCFCTIFRELCYFVCQSY